MTEFEKIDPTRARGRLDDLQRRPLGPVPMLQWLDIDKLVVDYSYQREIGRRGLSNIERIAREFSWLKFGPVVVAPVAGGLFAIVDGQHRTTAAAALGIEQVPCLIIQADPAEQADAFAAINSVVTAMTPMQIHNARLAAGDPAATELVSACRAAGVTICRYPVPANKMKPGETLAAAQLAKLFARFGQETFVLALRCITCGGARNTGLVRAPVVAALCSVIDAEPSLRTTRKNDLLALMARFDLASGLDAATIRAKKQKSNVATALAAELFSLFDNHLRLAA